MFDHEEQLNELNYKMNRIFPPIVNTDSVPTDKPRNIAEQFKLYKSGTTYRLYVFMDSDWYFVNLTKVT